MTELHLTNVSFSYPDGTKALENLTLSVTSGERVAIVGQNGAGKTTAVKLMNGLLKPTEGSVLVGDWDTKNHTTAQVSRKVGYVFQNPDDQIFHNDVESEVRFGPKNMGFEPERVNELTDWALKLCGISEFAEENPYNLPYSVRKFVTIASVLAMDSDIIILDEPTAGQDKIGLQVLGNLLQVLEEKQKSVITITHDMEFVTDYFTRIIVMANRQLVADENAQKVFYNTEVLEKSMLKPPAVAQMAKLLDFSPGILSKQQLIEAILAQRSL
ncbi:energy-coupling factor ABC transporter ATP-binding protein [Psychrobacillus lasiicapitis]|uniref:ABC transporter ATP-binding protein n=1 Tax=Psychrobacillus lasiicapitis TaxID=1636719 RepID=A0A544T4Z5_9BACI|nr:ABC transporter ATP-binding protein [Psychrobacillus lasiicapitis]TQR12499.1 ABC transporter ATP-binding protein [Psychrobacillus lasiicapitis]GGA38622.1 ABC transporter ATP-binding protein [Psychrobacillus lasiicapitis]